MGSKGAGKILSKVTGDIMGDGGAGAAQAAAMEQQSLAQRQFGELSGIAKKMSTAGIADMDRALAAQERSLARQEQLVAQIDPTIIEASQQALKLLRGESSSTLAPMQAQRAQQRQKLLNSLREQLGPGAETSSIGQQALSQFDLESQGLTAQAQQSALGQMGNIFGQFSAAKPNLGSEAMTFAQLAGGKADIYGKQASILSGAYQPLLQTAGAQYTADVMKGQQRSAVGQMALGAAIQGGMSAMGKPPGM